MSVVFTPLRRENDRDLGYDQPCGRVRGMGFNPPRMDGAERLRGARRRDPIPKGSPRGRVDGKLWELWVMGIMDCAIEEVMAYGER